MTGSALNAAEKAEKKGVAEFEKDVLPILQARCASCHGGPRPKGGLNLSSAASLLAGGESGPAIRIGAAEFSLLYEKVSSNQMPPKKPLTPAEKGVLRNWINDGKISVTAAAVVEAGEQSDFWSFQPPQRPPIPSVSSPVSSPARTAIDAFLLRELQRRNLHYAEPASAVTLIRRLYFDLLGTPPTPEAIERFAADEAPDAYERLVDRLLASPQYGERWGRHWLDVAGYADSAGVLSEDRPLPLAYRYRDYVIRAFNQDKPYDRFLQEQIAGDELVDYWRVKETADSLPADVVDGIVATGFLRCAPDSSRPDFNTIKNAHSQYYYPTINDTLQIMVSATMGLTIQCSRCHDHKYDPLPQVDYYRLQSVFMTALRPDNWVPQMNRRLPIASAKEERAAKEHNAKIDEQVKQLGDKKSAVRNEFVAKLFEERLAELPEPLREDARRAVSTAEGKRDEIEQYLATKFGARLKPAAKDLDAELPKRYPEFKKRTEELAGQIAAAQRRKRHFDEVRALYDLPGPTTTPLLLRGDPLTPGPAVEPGAPAAFAVAEEFKISPPPEGAKTSGRRLAFAKWLTQKRHPLTSRVFVNRIWLHHFGEGIVTTPEDFGAVGDPPSHPELLDWLAVEFVDSGWSIKHMHRLILMTDAYRQSSRPTTAQFTAGEQADPANRLLWRQRMRRLEAEPLRDALLSVSTLLDARLFGSPVRTERLSTGEVRTLRGQPDNRRSVYLQILRLNPLTFLEAFDQPVMATNCVRRAESTISSQALAMLNSDMTVAAAEAFADRVLREDPAAPAGRALYCAFGRPAEEGELAVLNEFLRDQQQRRAAADGKANAQAIRRLAIVDLCHMLLSANEFLYID